jgi:hypothetical protein
MLPDELPTRIRYVLALMTQLWRAVLRSATRVLLIRRYRGEVELTPPLQGLRGALERVEELASSRGSSHRTSSRMP